MCACDVKQHDQSPTAHRFQCHACMNRSDSSLITPAPTPLAQWHNSSTPRVIHARVSSQTVSLTFTSQCVELYSWLRDTHACRGSSSGAATHLISSPANVHACTVGTHSIHRIPRIPSRFGPHSLVAIHTRFNPPTATFSVPQSARRCHPDKNTADGYRGGDDVGNGQTARQWHRSHARVLALLLPAAGPHQECPSVQGSRQ